MAAVAESACNLRAKYRTDLDDLRRKIQSLRNQLYRVDQQLSQGKLAGFIGAAEVTGAAVEISKTALEVLLVRDRLDAAEAGDE